MRYQFAVQIGMIPVVSLAIGWLWPSLAQLPSPDQIALQPKQLGARVSFPEVGLTLPQPIGFQKATLFYGFEQSATSSSILLSVIPGPYAEVTKGFDKKGLATKNISLLSRQNIKIAQQPGVLLHLSQLVNGQTFLKWVVVFGDAQKTTLVTANFLKKNSGKLSEPLKRAVLAVSPTTVVSSGASTLPFRVTGVEGLVFVQKVAGFGKIAAFTKDGNIPNVSPADPFFLVTPSLNAQLVSDKKGLATKRLYSYPKVDITTIKSMNEISIDNIPGWELVADAQDQSSKIAVKIYQVMLFPEEGGYVLMTGIVGDKQSELYLSKFRAIALSYKQIDRQ
jgi:hypothetical protein